jgi:hypothetical protein
MFPFWSFIARLFHTALPYSGYLNPEGIFPLICDNPAPESSRGNITLSFPVICICSRMESNYRYYLLIRRKMSRLMWSNSSITNRNPGFNSRVLESRRLFPRRHPTRGME